jgi:hypothetical protein
MDSLLNMAHPKHQPDTGQTRCEGLLPHARTKARTVPEKNIVFYHLLMIMPAIGRWQCVRKIDRLNNRIWPTPAECAGVHEGGL